MALITSLQLTNFRSYEHARLEGLGRGAVVLYGENGAGKTNVLEAVSYLAPGRGLRSASLAAVQNHYKSAEQFPWAVAATVEGRYGDARLGSGLDAKKNRRIVRINGADASQSALGEYFSCVWLTPQMDRLFTDYSSARRRFLDRLVFTFNPSHAGRLTRYEKALRERSKLLKEHEKPQEAWLAGLEKDLAETGVAVAAARIEYCQRLQEACNRADAYEEVHFPRAKLTAAGTIEELLTHRPAVEVEEMFRYQLSQTREKDALTGGSATGPHKTDLSVLYAAKNMPADQCSTGEQKALLVGIILAHARLIMAEQGQPPVIMLDEVAAHLDEGRRENLYRLLSAMGCQVWMTGTDKSLFEALSDDAAFIHVKESLFTREERSAA